MRKQIINSEKMIHGTTGLGKGKLSLGQNFSYRMGRRVVE